MQRAPSTPRLGDDTKPSNMLPTTAVRPLHAELRMRIEPRAKGSHGTLHGALALELEVSEPVQSVTLHAHRLILRTPAALQSANASEALDCEAWTVDEDAQTVTFTWARLLEVGHYTLFVEWSVDTANTPPPRPGQRGWPGLLFAITSPTDYQHMTQFEPCNARTAYPCFDQPNTKCTFRLTLSNVPVGLVALSNTTVEREELSETNTRIITFHKTAPIASYLTAWYIGNLTQSSRSIAVPDYDNARAPPRTVDVRVFLPGQLGDAYTGEYALQLTCQAVDYFSRTFQLNYGYPKLDSVATELHPLLGMENVALITYKLGYLDVKSDNTTGADRRKRIARLVAHECVHQWFGNSTGVAWWSYLYLKEGFARLLEYFFCDAMFPEWEYWHHFQSDIFQPVLELDESPRTHPIERRIDVPAQIFNNVDATCYSKGASVLRQLYSYMGHDTFFKALQIYLRRHRNETVTPSHLWRAFNDADPNLGFDVEELMQTWVLQAGHPYLIVNRVGDGEGIQIEQHLCERVAGEVKVRPLGNSVPLYRVPVVARLGKHTLQRFVMAAASHDLVFEQRQPPFVLLNANAMGFYRVCYSERLLAEILANAEDISEMELCSVLLDTLFFFTLPKESIATRVQSCSSSFLVTFVSKVLETRIRSHYLWQLIFPHLVTLLMHLDLTPAHGHVASALRPAILRFHSMIPAEFAERGHNEGFDLLMSQVCSPLDTWSRQLEAAAQESIYALSQPEPILDEEKRAVMLNPLLLWCSIPATADGSASIVLAHYMAGGFAEWARHAVLQILLRSHNVNVLRTLLRTVAELRDESNLLRLLRRTRSRFIASACLAECAADNTSLLAEEARSLLDADPAGVHVRAVFDGFQWRSMSGDRSRSVSFGRGSPLISSGRPLGSEGDKGQSASSEYLLMRYVPFGLVMLGAGALVFASWKWLNGGSDGGGQ